MDYSDSHDGVRNPFESAPSDHDGVAALQRAQDYFMSGDSAAALEACESARLIGVPAELDPVRYVVHSACAALAGDARRGLQLAERGWREFPDYAALPAIAGICRALQRDDDTWQTAMHELYAALISQDPDGSLQYHRGLFERFRSSLLS